MSADDRYTVISADCHAGADLYDYKPYLEQRYHDEFDSWANDFVNPFADLTEPDAARNWDSDRRLGDLDAEGIAGEVLFPNTVPPFFPRSSLAAPPPETARDVELRWAGLRAHNRWLADFCALEPERRAGVGQVLLNDLDAAVAEVARIDEAGLRGGVLLPSTAPGSGLPPFYAEHWRPLWAACADRGVVVNQHGGAAGPPPEPDLGSALAVWVYESFWWAHRLLWHLLFSGAFERYPTLQVALTEQGSGWLAACLDSLDVAVERYRRPSAVSRFAGPDATTLSMTAREYWDRQCHVGASFMRPVECELRDRIGVDRIMWGSDYPHYEGTAPHTREALRHTFSSVDPGEVAQMVGGNAAALYGFDLEALAPLAAKIGPTVAEVATPLDAVPAGAVSTAFENDPIRAW